jgi:hypothetical protein
MVNEILEENGRAGEPPETVETVRAEGPFLKALLCNDLIGTFDPTQRKVAN